MSDPLRRTQLYAEHLKLGAKMTPFNGWDMPLYYTSILDEHKSVRSAAGLFDVSHMGQVFVGGAAALSTLDELVVSNLTKLAEGRACYTMLLNEQGGILDDIIIFRVAAQECLVVVNCANREKDLAWMQQHRQPGAAIALHPDRAILAVQGPQAGAIVEATLGVRAGVLNRFDVMPLKSIGPRAWISRTGYTGSDGFELFVPGASAVELWQRLLQGGASTGIQPIGLGARDTLRLEAGLRLCGTDMDESTTPYEADLGWTVVISKPSFIGKAALVQQKAVGIPRKLVGFELEQGPVPRHGCPVSVEGHEVGTVTSGTFSVMLNKPIGFAYIERDVAAPGTTVAVTIRNKPYAGTMMKMPFWREPAPAQPALSITERR